MNILGKWGNKIKNESPSDQNNHDLKYMVKHERTNVPEVIFRITECLDQKLTIESLYRKPGNKEHVLKLLRRIPKINYDQEDPHDLASLLKTIVTELEQPLLLKTIFETFRETSDRSQIREDLKRLDSTRRETVEHLIRHLQRVVKEKEVNKMNKHNICIVWAPVVYYPLETRLDVDKCIEFFGVLMDMYGEEQINGNVMKTQTPQRPSINQESAVDVTPEQNEEKLELLEEKKEEGENSMKYDNEEEPKENTVEKMERLEIAVNTMLEKNAGKSELREEKEDNKEIESQEKPKENTTTIEKMKRSGIAVNVMLEKNAEKSELQEKQVDHLDEEGKNSTKQNKEIPSEGKHKENTTMEKSAVDVTLEKNARKTDLQEEEKDNLVDEGQNSTKHNKEKKKHNENTTVEKKKRNVAETAPRKNKKWLSIIQFKKNKEKEYIAETELEKKGSISSGQRQEEPIEEMDSAKLRTEKVKKVSTGHEKKTSPEGRIKATDKKITTKV